MVSPTCGEAFQTQNCILLAILPSDFYVLTATGGMQANSFATATFGGGCFWGPDLRFARVPGVLDTEVGYSQGTVPEPSYEDVCSGLTGHNEVVKVRLIACPSTFIVLVGDLLLTTAILEASAAHFSGLFCPFKF